MADLGRYPNLRTEFRPDLDTVIHDFVYGERPSFTSAILQDLVQAQIDLSERTEGVRTVLWGSTFPGAFGFGGDLSMFAAWIRSGDLTFMQSYGRLAVDAVYGNAVLFRDHDVETVSCVSGDALGGGLEAALSSAVVVAEAGGKVGFPEIGFGYFPGMGAVDLVAAKAGFAAARRLALAARPVTTDELHGMGLVDILVPKGEARNAALDYAASRRNEHEDARKARRLASRVPDRHSMIETVLDWAGRGMRLRPTDLRKIDRLVSAQNRRGSRGEIVEEMA